MIAKYLLGLVSAKSHSEGSTEITPHFRERDQVSGIDPDIPTQ